MSQQMTVEEFESKFPNDFKLIGKFYSIYYSYGDNFQNPYIEYNEKNLVFSMVLIDDDVENIVQVFLDNHNKEITLELDSKRYQFGFDARDKAITTFKDHMEKMKCYILKIKKKLIQTFDGKNQPQQTPPMTGDVPMVNTNRITKSLSKSAKNWVLKQVCFKEVRIKDGEEVLWLIHEKMISTGDFGPVGRTYVGFVDCPVCSKKVDCIIWDGEYIYLEIDLRKDRASPVHWCELSKQYHENEEIQSLVKNAEDQFEAMRRMV